MDKMLLSLIHKQPLHCDVELAFGLNCPGELSSSEEECLRGLLGGSGEVIFLGWRNTLRWKCQGVCLEEIFQGGILHRKMSRKTCLGWVSGSPLQVSMCSRCDMGH